MRQHSRWTRLLALLLGSSLIAAACGGDGNTEGDDAMGDADPKCEGRSDGVLTIGGLLPETGNLDFLGPPTRAAAELAVAEINEAGGVLGEEVEYLNGDSGDETDDHAANTVEDHLAAGADVILGAAASGISLNVIDTITGACTIQFSPASTSPQFTDYDDDDLFFRTAPSDVLQGKVIADMMLDDEAATAAIVARGDAYGEGFLAYTKRPFEERGGEVIAEQVYDPEAEDFGAEVDAVVAADPDALVLVGFSESHSILASLFDKGFTPDKKKVYLVDGNIGNALGAQFEEKGALVGVRGTFPSAEVSDEFTLRMKQQNPKLVDYTYGPETFDAIVISALATVAAGTDEPAEVARHVNAITRDGTECTTFADCKKLIDAGEDIGYRGPSGPLRFSTAGEPTAASFAVMTYGKDNQIADAETEYRQAKL